MIVNRTLPGGSAVSNRSITACKVWMAGAALVGRLNQQRSVLRKGQQRRQLEARWSHVNQPSVGRNPAGNVVQPHFELAEANRRGHRPSRQPGPRLRIRQIGKQQFATGLGLANPGIDRRHAGAPTVRQRFPILLVLGMVCGQLGFVALTAGGNRLSPMPVDLGDQRRILFSGSR